MGKRKKKKEKEERRKKSLSRIGQWNFSLPERIVETIFLKLGTRIRNFPFLSRLFQPIDPSGIRLSNFLFPDIRNRCSSSLDNDKWKIEENLFLFFFWRILRSFQTRNSLVYLFRVIIISTLQPSKILSLNIKRRTNIRKCFPFFNHHVSSSQRERPANFYANCLFKKIHFHVYSNIRIGHNDAKYYAECIHVKCTSKRKFYSNN